ncbi:MAG: sulfatase-like hydrolase/transferase, partial [Gammaproteobacteria bacterium]
MVHSPPPGWGMLPMIYRGGKGDFTEGGVRTPAFAWWPGVIDSGQLVGDIIHVTDLYTTFARLGGATENIPTDRVVDGLDQTALFLNGDTHSRRDYVHIYAGHTIAATVKGRYKRHWIGAGDVAASGMPEAYYDLYMDPREENPQLVPMIHFQGQFNQMYARHMLMKEKYPDVDNGKGIPYTGLSNARPETKRIAERVKELADALPFDVEEYIDFEIPGSDSVGDWGQ